MTFIDSVDYFRFVLENSKCFQLAMRLSKYEKQQLIEAAGWEAPVEVVSGPVVEPAPCEVLSAIDDIVKLGTVDCLEEMAEKAWMETADELERWPVPIDTEVSNENHDSDQAFDAPAQTRVEKPAVPELIREASKALDCECPADEPPDTEKQDMANRHDVQAGIEQQELAVRSFCCGDCYDGRPPRTDEDWEALYRSVARGIFIGNYARTGANLSYQSHIEIERIINSVAQSNREEDTSIEMREEERRRIRNLKQMIVKRQRQGP